MTAEKSAETENENDAVCPKCDDEATAVDEDATNNQEQNANEGAAAAKKHTRRKDEITNPNVEIRKLIEDRRNTARGEKQHLKEVTKQIRKCIRYKKRSKRQNKIKRILEEFRGIKNIICKKSAKDRVLISKVNKGDTITSKQGTTNVLDEVYCKFHAGNETEEKLQNTLNHDFRAMTKKTTFKVLIKNTFDHK